MKTTIDMAREAGLFTHKEVQAELKAFEALVRADEREACAFLVEENVQECNGPIGFVLQSNADAIRARGNT
jgi:hypothetical protein